MPRVFWFVLAAGALVWAAALFGVDEHPQHAAVALPGANEPAPQPAAQPEPAVAAAPAAPVPPPALPAAQTVPPPATVRPVGSRALFASASATLRAARDAFLPHAQPAGPPPPQPGDVATGELGEGFLSPEYAAIERAYVYEPRDGAWASEQEASIRALLKDQPLANKLSIVNCQQTICRVVFEQAPADGFRQLMQVPGLPGLSGLTGSSPYSYRSGQLSVYFARRSAIIATAP